MQSLPISEAAAQTSANTSSDDALHAHDSSNRVRRPSVLVVTPIYPWPGSPPEGIFVHRQIRRLARLGHRCRVLCFRPGVPGLPRELVDASWLRYHPRWMTWRKLHDEIPVDYVFYPQRRRRRGDVIPAVADSLIRHIEHHPEYADTDVVYSHWLWPGGTAALALRDRFGWPVAAIARGSEMHAWQAVHPHCRTYVHHTLATADLVLANCEALRQAAEGIDPASRDRVRVLYNGCDATDFRPADSKAAARAAVGFSGGLNYFVCCATVIERKGMRELASAWRSFHAHHRSWRLVVIGPIVSKELAACLYAAGRGTIRLVGRVDGERVLPYLQAADAYVQPSLQEGLANATMEAMATAVPTVSTDAGGQRELVRDGDNGWLVPTGDSSALSAAMTELAADPNRARLFAQRGRQTVVDRFDPVVHTAQLSEMLTELHARQSSLVAR